MCYLVKNSKLTYKVNLGYLSPGTPQEDNRYTVLELEEILEVIVFHIPDSTRAPQSV